VIILDLHPQRLEQLKQIRSDVQQKIKKLEKLAQEKGGLTCGWKSVSQPLLLSNPHAYLFDEYHYLTSLESLL